MSDNKTKNNFSRYEDPTGEFSNRELKMGEWYVLHKLKLRRIFLLILITWSVVSVVGSLFYWGYYLMIGYNLDQQMANLQAIQVPNYVAMHQMYGAKELQISNVEVYQSASKQYDLVAQMKNPNDRWIAILTYKFSYSGKDSDTQTTVIMPMASRPLIIFGQYSDYYPTPVSLQIVQIKWLKVNPHSLVDVASFVKEKTNFEIVNFRFIPANSFYNVPQNDIKFEITNNSPYSYWHIDFYVELLNEGSVVGYAYVPVEKLMTKEVRQVEKAVLVDNIYVSDIKVYPVVNVFDSDSYILPEAQGATGTD